MRILMLSDVYFPRVNGVSTSIQTFRADLRELGTEVTLVAPQYPTAAGEDATGHGDEFLLRIPSRAVPLDPEDRAMSWSALQRDVWGRRSSRPTTPTSSTTCTTTCRRCPHS
jgi:hypothetical protein